MSDRVANAFNNGENRYRQIVLGQGPLPGYPVVRRDPWSYLETKPAADAPPSDNPSGLYCPACRGAGLYHCSEPEYCGSMKRMAPVSASSSEAK